MPSASLDRRQEGHWPKGPQFFNFRWVRPAANSPAPNRQFPHDRKTRRSRYWRPDPRDGLRGGVLAPLPDSLRKHDEPSRLPVLLPLPLDHVNCVRKPADEGCVDHCGCLYLATARPVAAERRLASQPRYNRGVPAAHKRTLSSRRTGSSRSTQADRALPFRLARRQAYLRPSHYEGVAPRLLVSGSMRSDRSIGV
jgi:hypothetical protein